MLLTALRRGWPLLLAPLFLALSGLNGFPYPAPEARFSDFAISHFPNALHIQRTLLQTGAPSLWSDLILSGYPFYADPLSGLHYPPGWLAFFFPLPFGLNLVALLHVLVGGIGMALFLRRQGLGQPAALFGALAFQWLPKFWAHYGAGHLTLLYAFQWLPWLLWAAGQGRGLLPGLFLGLMALADPRAAAYGGLLWLTYAIAHSQTTQKNLLDTLKSLALAFLLAAPLALPLLRLLPHTTRAALTPADVLALSLPPTRLLGLLVPDFGGPAEWTLYPGLVVLFLSLAALLAGRGRFWGGVAFVSLLWSLGAALPGAEWLAGLPGVSLLRVPPRALFITGFALAVLAALGLQALQNGLPAVSLRRLRLAWVGLAGLLIIFAVGVAAFSGALPSNVGWAAVLAGLLAALGLAFLAGRLSPALFGRALLLLLLLDLAVMAGSLFSMRPAAVALAEGRPAAEWLAAQPGDFRVYSPSYSIPQHTAADLGLRLADGVNPLQLTAYAEFFAAATGVPQAGYSVTLPPLPGDPATANAAYTPDAARLAELDVRYIAAEFPLAAADLVLVAQFDSTRIYENLATASQNRAPQPFPSFPPELAAGLVLAAFGLLWLGWSVRRATSHNPD